MMLLIGALGWGLLAIGAVTHVWHHARLRELLALHFDREAVPALALTTVEAVLAVMLPVSVAVSAVPTAPFVIAALVLAVGFAAWIARLLLANSELPCACSFSAAPTTVWSLARAAVVLCVGALGFVSPTDAAVAITTFVVGAALAGAVFVLPDAISWPAASRATLERARAHNPVTTR